MQGQQLLSQRQILQDEVCLGPQHSRQPAEQVSKKRKHGSNPIRPAENDEACKSFKLRAVTILANDRHLSAFASPVEPCHGRLTVGHAVTVDRRIPDGCTGLVKIPVLSENCIGRHCHASRSPGKKLNVPGPRLAVCPTPRKSLNVRGSTTTRHETGGDLRIAPSGRAALVPVVQSADFR